MITHNRQCVCVCVRLKCAFTRTNPYHLRKEARRKKTETNIRQATKSTIEIFFHEIQAQRSAKVIIDHPPNKMIMLQGIHWNTESTAWPILSRHMSSDKKSDDDVYLPFHRIFPLYHSGTVFVWVFFLLFSVFFGTAHYSKFIWFCHRFQTNGPKNEWQMGFRVMIESSGFGRKAKKTGSQYTHTRSHTHTHTQWKRP